jgi:predicted DNA-binding transcriptional regulator AlpA
VAAREPLSSSPIARRPPTLDAVVTSPDCTAGLPLTTLVDLRRQAACALAELDARIALALADPPPSGAPEDPALLDVAAAAKRLGVSRDWLYKKAHTLPFAVRVGPRQLRFSAAGIRRWLERRQGLTRR